MPVKLLTISLARVRDASREAESPGGHGQSTPRASCCQKEIWNKSNERKHHILTRMRKLYFWGKKFLYLLYQLYLFDFLS